MKVFKLLLMAFLLLVSFTALAVDYVAQPGEYYKYDTTPTRVVGKTYKYIDVLDLETVNVTWVKLGTIWVKHVSAANSVRYYEKPTPTPVEDIACVGRFVCHKDWGLVIVFPRDQLDRCLAVKIMNAQVNFYGNHAVVNGEPACPVYPN